VRRKEKVEGNKRTIERLALVLGEESYGVGGHGVLDKTLRRPVGAPQPTSHDLRFLFEVTKESAARGSDGSFVVLGRPIGLIALARVANLGPAGADEFSGDVDLGTVRVDDVDDSEFERRVGSRDGVGDGERDLLADDEGAKVVATLERPRLVVAFTVTATGEARSGEVGKVEELLARKGVGLNDLTAEDDLKEETNVSS
jgi:hypothetical protein